MPPISPLRRFRSSASVALALTTMAATLPACGDGHGATCASDVRVDTYAPNMSKNGDNQKFMVHIKTATPAPPATGANDWMLMVMDLGGTMIPNATVTATATMPDHSHAPVTTTANAAAMPGMYMAKGINFTMEGVWKVTVDVDDGKGTTDRAAFHFCIGG